MGNQLSKLNKRLCGFISQQKIFFVATATKDGLINLSPKGMDSFRLVDDTTVIWLNLTGSGNETAAHLKHDGRMTIMFCSFTGPPLILRLYGQAHAYHQRDSFWAKNIGRFPKIPGSRQLIQLKIEMVQTSCGMGVPLMDYLDERHQLDAWAEEQGEKGIREYQEKKNKRSLDGLDTGIFG